MRHMRAAAALWPLIPLLAGCHHDGYTARRRCSAESAVDQFKCSGWQNSEEIHLRGRGYLSRIGMDCAPGGHQKLCPHRDRPDAPSGTFTHWVLYNIPAGARSLAAGLPRLAQLADGPRQGRNDFGKPGYGGPCPPRGTEHRYIFTLYALGTSVDLPLGATREQVERAIKGHVLAQGELTARYGR